MNDIEHILDKYGFPMAVVFWLFWRDWTVLRVLSTKLTSMTELLRDIASNMNRTP